MSDFWSDFAPSRCILCGDSIVGEQRSRCVDGGLVHVSCWMDETQPETHAMHNHNKE